MLNSKTTHCASHAPKQYGVAEEKIEYQVKCLILC